METTIILALTTALRAAQFDRLVAEWLGRDRRPPPRIGGSVADAGGGNSSSGTVNHLIHGFWQHAQIYYRKPDGTPTTELDNIRQALRPLRRLYGQTAADQFGPKSLKALREHMIVLGWCRSNINKQISRIKCLFRWASENELVPPTVHYGLLAVKGLKRGRCTARESEPVTRVPEERITAIKPFVSRQVWALVQLQLLTSARAGELVGLRGLDLKTGHKIWTAEPEDHKTAHHGHSKRIYFGPQATAVIQEFLQNRSVDSCLFSPAEADAERRAKLHRARIENGTPLSCGTVAGDHKKDKPQREPGDRYTVNSYRQAIWRGCDAAFPPPEALARTKVKARRGTRWETQAEWKVRLGPESWKQLRDWQISHRWHPHQLRHNAATHLRKEFGIEVARVILGHRSASVTEIYAELDDAKAKKVMGRIG